MNDHLVTKHKRSVLLSFSIMIIIVGVFFLIVDVPWYASLVIVTIFPHSSSKNILLDIIIKEDKVTIESNSIFFGTKKLLLDLNEIIALDFSNEFIIKYKDVNSNFNGEKKVAYSLNAEPWNDIYGQIKALKIAHQNI